MLFFFLFLNDALLATAGTRPKEAAVRSARKSERNMQNIWKFNVDRCDQIHAHYTCIQSKNINRTLFLRKHEKFFQITNISIRNEFRNKQQIQTRHITHNKFIPNLSSKNYNILPNEKYNIYQIDETSKTNFTGINKSNEGTHAHEILGYENISYPIYSYIKKDRRVGFKNIPTFSESDCTQNKIPKNLIRIRSKNMKTQNFTKLTHMVKYLTMTKIVNPLKVQKEDFTKLTHMVNLLTMTKNVNTFILQNEHFTKMTPMVKYLTPSDKINHAISKLPTSLKYMTMSEFNNSLQRTNKNNFEQNCNTVYIYGPHHLQFFQSRIKKAMTKQSRYVMFKIVSATIHALQVTFITYQNIVQNINFAYIMLLSIICKVINAVRYHIYHAEAQHETSSDHRTCSYIRKTHKNYFVVKMINSDIKVKKPPPGRTRRHKVSRSCTTHNKAQREDVHTPSFTTNMFTNIFNIFCSKIHTCGNEADEGKEAYTQQEDTTSDTKRQQTSVHMSQSSKNTHRGRRGRTRKNEDNDDRNPTPRQQALQEDQDIQPFITYNVSFTYNGFVYDTEDTTKVMIYKSIIADGYYVADITKIDDNGTWRFTMRVMKEHKDTLVQIMSMMGIEDIDVQEVVDTDPEAIKHFQAMLIEKNMLLAASNANEVMTLDEANKEEESGSQEVEESEEFKPRVPDQKHRYIICNGTQFEFTMCFATIEARLIYDEYMLMKVSIYKAFPMKGYYISDITADESNGTCNVTFTVAMEYKPMFQKLLEQEGITPEEEADVTETIDQAMLNTINDSMKEREELLSVVDAKYVKKYNITPRAMEETHTMIYQEEDLTRIHVSMQVFEKCDTINDEEYMLTKLIMSFPGIKGYVMTEHEDTTYNMVINAASFTAFIKQANKLNIPFTVEQVFTLTSEMEEYEITSILNNTALRESIAASPIRKQCVNTCQEFTYTIQQEEDEELIAKLYTKEQAEIYITDCKYDETTHAYTITCIADYKQYLKFISQHEELDIKICRSILIQEEDEAYITSLKETKQQLITEHIANEEARKQAQFDAIPIAEKREQVTQLFHAILDTEDENQKLAIYGELQKYRGIDMREEGKPESYTLLTNYIADVDTTFAANEGYVFMDALDSIISIKTRFIKCPLCDHASSDISWIIQHIKQYHKERFNKQYDPQFILLMLMKDKALESIIEEEPHICYKCPQCTFIHSSKSLIAYHYKHEHTTEKAMIKEGYIGNVEQIKAILQAKADEERRRVEAEEAEKARQIQEAEEEARREQQKIEDAARAEKLEAEQEHARILALSQEAREQEINTIFEHIMQNEDISMVEQGIIDLARFTGTLSTDNNEDMPLYLAAINGYNNEAVYNRAIISSCDTICNTKSYYAETIANLTNTLIDKYCFIEKGTGYTVEVDLMIRCPFCKECCNNDEWMKKHMKKCHMQTMQETIGYLWTFILHNSDNALLSGKEYFNPIDGYICTECGFIHTKEHTVRQHCAIAHGTRDITIKRGATGRFTEAFFARKKLYKRSIFQPQHTARRDAYMYYLSRGYKNATSQTQYIAPHVEVKTSGTINGGATGASIGTHTRFGQRSALIGCHNPSCACYMNALIQSLYSINAFRSQVMQYNEEVTNIMSILHAIFTALGTPQNAQGTLYIDPAESRIYRYLGYRVDIQSDPSEVLTNILTNIEASDENLYDAFKFTEITHNTNDGDRNEAKPTMLEVYAGTQTSQEYTHNIEDLISSNINTSNNGINRVTTLNPQILAVMLSRSYGEAEPKNTEPVIERKLMYKVNVRKTLQTQHATFIVKAIMVHKGETAANGHYVTYAFRGDAFYLFNDTNVQMMDVDPNAEYIYQDNDRCNDRVTMIFYEKISDEGSNINTNQSSSNTHEHTNEESTTHTVQEESESSDWSILSQISEYSDHEESEPESQTQASVVQSNNENTNTHSDQAAQEVENNTQIDEGNIREEALNFYNTEMQKLANIRTSEEGKAWITTLSQSPYFGCLQGKLNDEELNDMSISEIGMLVTKIMPPLGKQQMLCCYPGCCYTSIASARKQHWRSHHSEEQEEPLQYDNAHTAFAVACLHSRFTRRRSDNGTIEEMQEPVLTCPLCGISISTTNQKAWTSHITGKHQDLGKRLNTLGRFWSVESYNFARNEKLSLSSYARPLTLCGCPYCTFCASTDRQVIMHINNVHKEHQTDGEKYSITVDYRVAYAHDKEELEQRQQQQYLQQQNTTSEAETPSTHADNITQAEDSQPAHDENQNQQNAETNDLSINTQDDVEHEVANNEEEDHEEDEEEEDFADIELNEFRNAIRWSQDLRDHQASIPRMNLKSRMKLVAPISNFIKDTAIPMLRRFIRTRRGYDDEERWQAIDGVISYIESEITNIIINTLGIRGKRKPRKEDPENDANEIEYAQISTCRDAAAKSASLISAIIREMDNDEDAQQVKMNKIYALKDRCIMQLRNVDDQVVQHVFQCSSADITGKDIDDFIAEGEARVTAKLTYLSNAFDEQLIACEDKRKKYQTKKVQELYSEDPKRAMRWYVDKDASPHCPIDIEEVRSKLAERWQAENSYMPPGENEGTLWMSPFHFTEHDKERIMKNMTDSEYFEDIISTRNSQSANGPDGIGYAILKLDKKASSKMMALISKAMLKFQRTPTLWNRARTILLYKAGDPADINNWRPLSIASCMYRVWTATLANTLQAINTQHPIFHRSQKGFIRGVDGCLEHSQTIVELFNDANRRRKNLYTLTIDLKDAFGSIPHGYILEMMDEIGFPEPIKGVIADSYDKGTTVINLDKLDSTEVRIRKGVKQGCPLSPLIFNMCMNPLLKELQNSNKGYRVNNRVISAQAYADDIILFSESRKGMEHLIDIVQRFVAYSRLVINAHKCHSLAYIIGESGRVTDTEEFTINGNAVPLDDLSHSIQYLGTAAAASIVVRYKGTEETIESTKTLINKVMNSQLKVNQKLDALRRFVIPRLDYTLTEGNPRIGDLEDLDRMMRVGIAKHIGVPSLPIDFAITHWKDGGLSLQPLAVRGSVLKIKKFIALYNSPNTQTRTLFRYFMESEREFRRVKKIGEDEESTFLDWETDSEGKIVSGSGGTSSITGTVNRECVRLVVKMKFDDDKDAAVVIKDEHGEEQTLSSPYMIARVLMKAHSMDARTRLVQQGMHGHSFVNLDTASDSNYLIGNYTNKVSDKIVSFMIAARTNTLYTGYISHHNGKHNGPKCPYCGACNEHDTLFHRLNNCTPAKYMYTYRHDLVAEAIRKQAELSYQGATIRLNKTIRVPGMPALTTPEASLRPDITIITKKQIHIIEISCPYDMPKDDGTTALDFTYNTKKEKYEELRKQCEQQYRRKCKTYVVIVSSLGAVHKDTIMDLKRLFRFRNKTKSLNYLTRKISTAALIGSFLTYYKINVRIRRNAARTTNGGNTDGEPTSPAQANEGNNDVSPNITDNMIGDVSREEPDLPEGLLL